MAETHEKDARVYELAYLFVPLLTEETVAASFGNLKALLEKHGAQFISEEMPKMMDLAYQMSRIIENKKTWFDNGYFGWVKFSATEEAVLEIKKAIDLSEKVLRHLLITTVAENTLYGAKLAPVEKAPTLSTDKVEEKAEVSQEDLDKSIDKLVI
jgi:ribosomal protein S6